jgi:uncharacterized surface protein with fasciclin (FAS1) repeats
MNQEQLQKRNRIVFAAILVIALVPLALRTLGPKFATEEMEERAEAGERNYEPAQRFPDSSYGLPQVAGAAADTTVADVTRDSALFERFNAALQQAGFEQVLSGPGPLTLFAPTDKAFDALPAEQRDALLQDREQLTALLSNHVVRGKLSATDLLEIDQVQTLGGETVPIDAGGGPAISFGKADIVRADLVAGNGVVHVVDSLNL